MKKITKFSLAIIMIGFSASSFAQSTATSAATSATATIVAPITISAGSTMSFGDVVKSTAGGTVILSTAGGRTPSGVSFSPTSTGSPAASSFTVNGEAAYTYAITLPASDVTLTKVAGTETMTVNGFTSNPGTTGLLDGTGAQTLLVGATLNVGAAQVAGVYSGTYTVKVDYN